MIPPRMVERLVAYRRHLRRWLAEGRSRIYSHELAGLAQVTSAVVRRDVMTIGYTGSPAKGYDAAGLIGRIGRVLDPPQRPGIALVGLGSLGRAVLKHFARLHPELRFVAAFDVSPEKVGRIIDGCRCHAGADLETVLRADPALVGIIAVPGEAAQDVADRLVRAGVRGILNLAPVRLQTPPTVYVEDVDLAVSLEKVVFFARPETERLEALA